MPEKKLTARERVRVQAVYERLAACYPDVRCSLDYQSPFQLLVMTILAAQCTDIRVNQVCLALFNRYKTPLDFAKAGPGELERAIHSCGFFNQKARAIRATCEILLSEYQGEVPGDMAALLQLPGVGRKIANAVLGECFGKPSVIVDTHCTRVARRLGFTRNTAPEKIERDLMHCWPREYWTLYSHYMVFHGRAVCQARQPKCSGCCVMERCPYLKKSNKAQCNASK